MALDDKAHISLSARENTFLLMPLIHSEEMELQRSGVELLRSYGTKSAHESAMRHLEVIKNLEGSRTETALLSGNRQRPKKYICLVREAVFKRQKAGHLGLLGLFRLHRIFSSRKTCSTNFTSEAKTRSCRTVLSTVKDYLEMQLIPSIFRKQTLHILLCLANINAIG